MKLASRTFVVTIASMYYAIYVFLAVVVEPFGWFGTLDLPEFGAYGHAALILGPLVVATPFALRNAVRKRALERMRGVTEVSIGTHRTDAFQDLRNRAKKKIMVVGVGMTSIVSYDLKSLAAQGASVPIEFLMLDPEFLENNPVFARHIEEFFDIPDFASKVRASFDRLKSFCEEWNGNANNQHHMALKVYQTIPTNSMTVIDPEDENGEALVEFFLYQSGANRPRFRARQTDLTNSMFERVLAEYRNLWNRSRRVV